MQKEELQKLVENLGIDKEIEKILFEIINDQQVMDDDFLNKFSNLLDSLSKYFANLADGSYKTKEQLSLLDDALKLIDLEQKKLIIDLLNNKNHKL